MPKNPNVKRVMVIGSGPIVIGQAAGIRLCRYPGLPFPEGRGSRGNPGEFQPGDYHDG